jgi:hypothetical protein
MPQAEREEDPQQRAEEKKQQLQGALAKLGAQTGKKSQGFSQAFLDQVQTPERAMELCEAAMFALSEQYVSCLERFKEASEPKAQLEALEEAETLWQREAGIVRHFDQEGEETQFLQEIRSQVLVLTNDKLEEAANACEKAPTEENAALCLALLGVMDTIYEEMGRPETSKERQRCRDLAKAFAS